MWKNSKMRSAAKVIAATLGITTFGWLMLASLIAYGFGGSALDNNPFDDLPFSRAVWLEDISCMDGSNRRGHMAQDIVHTQLHRGMRKQEIISLLGEPAYDPIPSVPGKAARHLKTLYFSNVTAPEARQAGAVMRYYLGEELDMAWGIDHADLYVYLDRQGRYFGSRIGWA